MASVAQPIVVRSGGSSSAGILLLFIGIVGLVMLFTGNLDRWIGAIAGKQGGAAGIVAPPAIVPEVAQPAPSQPSPAAPLPGGTPTHGGVVQ